MHKEKIGQFPENDRKRPKRSAWVKVQRTFLNDSSSE